MLKELAIENLAVISAAQIPLEQGFNAFTGETGAGKSILIHGIQAVLGQRTSKDLVRTGCKKAVITAQFSPLSDETRAVLAEYGQDTADDELLLTRESLRNTLIERGFRRAEEMSWAAAAEKLYQVYGEIQEKE